MFQTPYWNEFRQNWPVLLAACIGMAAGAGINSAAQAVIAPRLLDEFGWTKSQFALFSLLSIPAALFLPIVGRIVDVFGTRRTVLPGLMLFPISWLAFTMIEGSLLIYGIVSVIHLLIGLLTISIVYSRVILEKFYDARGLALSIMMSGPSLAIAVGAPLLTDLVNSHGWQIGYLAMSSFSAVGGGVAYLLIRSHVKIVDTKVVKEHARNSWSAYSHVLRSRNFWIIFLALLLCNIPNLLHAKQINLMLLDRGLDVQAAAQVISIFAVGVILGRFTCGFALDRLPVVPVAVTALFLPAVGFFMLSIPLGGFWSMALAMAMVGLAQGAEGEIGAILLLKYFKLDLFGTAYGMLTVNLILSTAIGSLTLSHMLAVDGTYTNFIVFGAITTLAGSLSLMLLPRRKVLLSVDGPCAARRVN